MRVFAPSIVYVLLSANRVPTNLFGLLPSEVVMFIVNRLLVTIADIMFVGDGGVGKTTFVKKMMTGWFEPKYIPTLGAETHTIETRKVRYHIYDTAGHERYACRVSHHTRMVDLIVIMYDCGSRVALKSVRDRIKKLDVPYIVVANKMDMCRICPRQMPPSHIKISTKTLQNCNRVFDTIDEILLTKSV
ncbi:MAG: hypothetical protein CMM25_02775, partial [Rhodospirillaceae bacterium]|nr:hypothetical protein [Rhodospirillaceae bacterium]